MNSEPREGDWFQTYTGVRFYPYDPRPEDVNIEDIAHHLSLLCRFNGAVRTFYSVAQHSVLVSRNVPPGMALWGLLHDAAEAYLGDMVRPLKMGMPQYRAVEERVLGAVAAKFLLLWPPSGAVKVADQVLLSTERRDLLPHALRWREGEAPLIEPIVPWDSVTAEQQFLLRFRELDDLTKKES